MHRLSDTGHCLAFLKAYDFSNHHNPCVFVGNPAPKEWEEEQKAKMEQKMRALERRGGRGSDDEGSEGDYKQTHCTDALEFSYLRGALPATCAHPLAQPMSSGKSAQACLSCCLKAVKKRPCSLVHCFLQSGVLLPAGVHMWEPLGLRWSVAVQV